MLMITLASVLLPPEAGLRCDDVCIDDAHCTVSATAVAATAACPRCAVSSATIHSRYRRTLRDVPCSGRVVHLCIEVRRFRCRNPACPQRIFAERLAPLAPTQARRTTRLTALLQRLALVLASEAAAPLLTACGMPISPTTLLRLQRRAPLPPVPPPRVIGVDEFAFRKGRRYGTLVVDLERHTPIAVLPDAQATTVAAWFRQQPQLTIIARDRAGAFAEAATQGAPQATQVADRFHLAKNAGEVLERVLQQQPAALRQAAHAAFLASVPAPPPATPGAAPAAEAGVAAAAAPPAQSPETVREQRLREVLALQAQGWSVRRIALALHLNRRTVTRYTRTRELPKRGAPYFQVTSAITPYRAYLRERWAAGCHNGRQLWQELSARGYGGSLSSVYRALKWFDPSDRRRGTAAGPTPGSRRTLSPHQGLWLLVRDEDALTPREQAARAALLAAQPAIAAAATLTTRFLALLRERCAAALDPWLSAAAASELVELRRFAASLRRDRQAVRAALEQEWSTGQLEGQINRVKLIKRVGYGRATFALLQRRILCAA
jgi:transposase